MCAEAHAFLVRTCCSAGAAMATLPPAHLHAMTDLRMRQGPLQPLRCFCKHAVLPHLELLALGAGHVRVLLAYVSTWWAICAQPTAAGSAVRCPAYAPEAPAASLPVVACVCAGRLSQQSAHACLVAPAAASLQHTNDVLSVTVHSCPCNRSASQAKISHLQKLQRHMRISSTGVRCACDEDATPGGHSGCCCWRDLRALRMLSRFEPFLFHVNRGFGCGCSATSALPGCSCCT